MSTTHSERCGSQVCTGNCEGWGEGVGQLFTCLHSHSATSSLSPTQGCYCLLTGWCGADCESITTVVRRQRKDVNNRTHCTCPTSLLPFFLPSFLHSIPPSFLHRHLSYRPCSTRPSVQTCHSIRRIYLSTAEQKLFLCLLCVAEFDV